MKCCAYILWNHLPQLEIILREKYLRQYSQCDKGCPVTGRTLQQWKSSHQTFPKIYYHVVMHRQTAQSKKKKVGNQTIKY